MVEKIPENPGVYIFKDLNGKILYIGKAKNLKKRISSYFQKNHSDLKTELLVRKIKDIEWIITKNEIEALILENNLIKKHRPPFNIKLADDKTYPYLKINLNEDFPRLEITRRKDDPDSIYFGPYTSAYALKSTVNFIQKNFKLRKCNDKKFRNRLRPCLNYQINLCMAPCCGYVSKEEYREIFNEVFLLLSGKTEVLINKLKEKMNRLSENLEFEKAAEVRDLIFNVEKFIENKNQSVEIDESIDTDVFHYIENENGLFFYVLKLKKGKIIDSDYYTFKDVSMFEESALENFIPKYYLFKGKVPEKIIVPENDSKSILEEFFEKEFGKKVEIIVSDNDPLIEICRENLIARIKFEIEKTANSNILKRLLKLRNTPVRIDAFDISTFQGKDSVGARVTFINGLPEKSYYRRYRIKSVIEPNQNDFLMMYEVISRSAEEYIEKNDFPDLILIDGGKGQLNMAYKALAEKGIVDRIDLISIAKERNEGLDRIYKHNRKNPINIKNENILRFLMKIRDEVHRFAIEYHRKRDELEKEASLLLKIEGVGPKRAKALLQHFKNIDKIRESSVEELKTLPFLNEKVAKNIVEFFKSYQF